STTATALRTLTINPNAASVSALGSGTRTLTVDSLTGLTFGNNQAFSGGTLLKDGGGVLTLGGAASTFSKLQVEMGTVRGFLNGNTTLGGGPSVFGAGNISVSGGDTVLEITGTNNADTLTIGNNANINLSGYATFKLSGGGLALVGGTINLNGNGILDYGAGTVTLGNTAILGASAEGFNCRSNLIFPAHTGNANTGSFRYNLTNSGTQILSRDNAGAVTVSGTMIKTGAGNTVIDPSITSLTLTRGLQLDAGTLTFTKANQYASALTFTGNAATVSLAGFNQTIGGVTINAGASGIFALGGNTSTSTTLALGTVTLGDTSSVLRVRDYTDGTLLAGAADVVTTSSALTTPQLSQIWFYGYNKGATLTGGELKPAGGLLDSTWDGPPTGTKLWFDAVNWVGDDEYAIPNSIGAMAQFNGAVSGTFYQDAVSLGGRAVTVGAISETDIGTYFYIETGTLIFDTGVAGQNAQFFSNNGVAQLSTTLVLNSNLEFGTAGQSSLRLIGLITGTGGLVFRQGSDTSIYPNNNTFSGGVDIYTGRVIYLYGNNSSSYTAASFLGTGTITIHGGGRISGRNPSNSSLRHMVQLNNPLVFDQTIPGMQTLYTYATYFNYSGDVLLPPGGATINVDNNTTSSNYSNDSVIFGSNLNFTGTSGLTFSGAYIKRMYSGNHTFTGGLTLNQGTLWIAAGAADIVVGESSPGNNFLGAGNVNVSGGASLWAYTTGKIIIKSGTLNITNATFGYSAVQGTWLDGGAVTGDGNLRVDQDLYFNGGTLAPTVNLYWQGGGTSHVYSTANDIYSGTIRAARVIKTESAVKVLDSSIKKMVLTNNMTINGGAVRLGADEQLTTTTLILNGGVFDTAGFTNSGIAYLAVGAGGGILLLGDDGGLQFTNASSSWLPTGLLTIASDNQGWVASGTGAYVRFINDVSLTLTAAMLQNIGFTGFERGAEVTRGTDNLYYLLPTGGLTSEWSGAGLADQVNWGTAGNWLDNTVPDAAGASATFRDQDAQLSGKIVNISGAYTVGKLDLASSADFVLGGSGTLIFNNSGSNAQVTTGGRQKYFAAAWRLDSDTDLRVTFPDYTVTTVLANAISGTGNLRLVGTGYSVTLRGNNSAWSGDFIWDDAVRIRLDSTAPTISGSGKFYIGDTGSVKTYTLEATGGGRVLNAPGGWVLNGHLATGMTPNSFYYNLTINGSGSLSAGQHTIASNWNSLSSIPVLTFSNTISGPGGITTAGVGRISFLSSNDYTGDFIWDGNTIITLGADDALGKGTFQINSASSGYTNTWNVAPAGGVKLSNKLEIPAGSHIIYFNGGPLWLDSDSSAVGSSVLSGTLAFRTGTVIFGKKLVLTGTGAYGMGGSDSQQEYWLGENNTFSGGYRSNQHANANIVIGASSTKDADGNVLRGPIGTGTLTMNGQPLAVYSDAAAVTAQRLSNPIVISSNAGVTFNGGRAATGMAANYATTLILDTGTIQLLSGADTSFNITSGSLVLESRLMDGAVPGQLIKNGAGTLELTNAANQLTAGIEARAGLVLIQPAAADFVFGAGYTTPFGSGTLVTRTVTGDGTAGAFQVNAVSGGTVTLTGSNSFVLNDNGRLIVSGSNITTVLASGGYLVSTDTAGQEGSIVADLVKTTNYTLGVKMAAQNWQLGAGSVHLARAKLSYSAGTITFQAGSRLNVNHNVQTLSNIVVDGNATIDVSGGLPSNPVIVTIGSVTVNAGLLTFAGWAGDIPTGKGSTIVQSTLTVGTVVHGVSLDSGIEQAIVRRNIDGVNVLIPYDLIFTWDGQAGNNLWEVKDWSKNGTHSDIEQPDGVTATAIFDTTAANLSGQTVNLSDNRRVGTLNFTGATKVNYTLSGAGYSILLDSGVSGAETFITNDGASDVTLNTNFQLVYYAPDGENLQITQNGSGNLFFNGQISGPDSTVTVSGSGAGAVIFSGNNTFSKEFILSSGLVWLGANSGVGNGPLGGGLVT
ncbi:MAG: hypothetical protein LBK71_01865, partial [Verrucomicrobiales bacterium]|nr:hypothetical protein [Verrucomicrobiales bacterium]